MGKPLFFSSRDEFREWLEANHATATEATLGFYRQGTGHDGIGYDDAVEEALCFGWIDGVRRRLDAESYTGRFSPRRGKGSNWSAINVRRVERLIAEGRMRPAGLAAFEARKRSPAGYSYEEAVEGLPDAFEAELRANPAAWEYWQARPPGYRWRATFWVMSAKREETRQRRLRALIEDSAAGRHIKMLRRDG